MCLQDCVPSGGSRRESVSLPLPASRGHLHPLAPGQVNGNGWSGHLPVILDYVMLCHKQLLDLGRFKLYYYFFFLNVFLFIYFWLCWVFVSVQGLSLVAASGGHSSSRCAGLSLSRPLLLRSTGSRRAGSVIVAHGPSHSAACGILPDQGSNPCPLHWQVDSQPLCHQGSPAKFLQLWGALSE